MVNCKPRKRDGNWVVECHRAIWFVVKGTNGKLQGLTCLEDAPVTKQCFTSVVKIKAEIDTRTASIPAQLNHPNAWEWCEIGHHRPLQG